MDCATFEERLTLLLGGELEPDQAAALKRHAEGCATCRPCVPLIEVGQLPVDRRDPADVPFEHYWDGLSAAVRRRVSLAGSDAPARGWSRWVAAAAVVGALSIGWIFRAELVGHGPVTDPAGEHTRDTDWALLQDTILDASAEELDAALNALPGEEWGGAWVPELDQLDSTDQQRLSEWLDQLDREEGRPRS